MTTPTDPEPEGTRPPTRRRPGGRTARIRKQVLDAVLSELGEHGYDGLTTDTVAARAGVHRTTVYRRWGDVGGFVGHHTHPPPDPPQRPTATTPQREEHSPHETQHKKNQTP
ncbi:TetR/AcrR family transcriptional regulator, partial [Streptomyces sp. NPDC057557]|uniref:TetR/AcrR family transcriptional regulator n=1 Tax=Streptomyces sp. NPDC057557 TaxID=3346167 RepID=UPI0036C886BC